MKRNKIQLSDHFTYGRLIRFTFPSVIMMIFTSIYGVVDGIFVSNFVGKTPFAAINLIMPFLMILNTLGMMVGAGGSALISKLLGEGEHRHANRVFSLLIYSTAAVSIVLTVVALLYLRPICVLLGAEGEILEHCLTYGRIILPALTFSVLQVAFQSLFITAERPKLGLMVTVISGISNIVLDALLVAKLQLGLPGAAMATAFSQFIGGIIPVIYFLCPNKSLLRLAGCDFEGKALIKTCTNGSSELMTNISGSLVSMLYNFQLLRLAGENGIAAYGVIMYVNFIFISLFIGYSIGSAPIISFHYGAQNHDELHNMFVKSLRLVGTCCLILTLTALLLSKTLAGIFVGYDEDLLSLTLHGFRLYSICFLLIGFNIFGSSFFTALNNGLVSAAISFLRTLVFQVGAVLLLPLILGLDGIWLSVLVAELFSLAITVYFLLRLKKDYHY